MGQEASVPSPQPGTSIRVIGAGLPRTGTASLSAALEILLGGPVYHGGTQCCQGPEAHIKNWISILRRTPLRTPADEKFVLKRISAQLDGYVATTDAPGCMFVPELLRLYPDAKVVCTVSDPMGWARSIDAASQHSSMQWFLKLLLLPVTPMRHFPTYLQAITEGRWSELYESPRTPQTPGIEVWEKHVEHLRNAVPKENLLFFDCREGWGPLCKALDVPVPQGIDFPRINDGDAIDKFSKQTILKALVRWAVLFGGVAVAVGGWRRGWVS
ncbi:P-loop containing nucleoside triphosphate hydrolase protein [Xylariaceae sp. FL0016]|nr:P-loop containing nucleoside triphosphate hydrolase protein [Xylariaceae sp. FL0016]